MNLRNLTGLAMASLAIFQGAEAAGYKHSDLYACSMTLQRLSGPVGPPQPSIYQFIGENTYVEDGEKVSKDGYWILTGQGAYHIPDPLDRTVYAYIEEHTGAPHERTIPLIPVHCHKHPTDSYCKSGKIGYAVTEGSSTHYKLKSYREIATEHCRKRAEIHGPVNDPYACGSTETECVNENRSKPAYKLCDKLDPGRIAYEKRLKEQKNEQFRLYDEGMFDADNHANKRNSTDIYGKKLHQHLRSTALANIAKYNTTYNANYSGSSYRYIDGPIAKETNSGLNACKKTGVLTAPEIAAIKRSTVGNFPVAGDPDSAGIKSGVK